MHGLLHENKNGWGHLVYFLLQIGVFISPRASKPRPPNKIISLAKASSRKEKQAGLGLISAPLLIYNRDKPLFSLRPVLRSHFALASTMLDHEASSP